MKQVPVGRADPVKDAWCIGIFVPSKTYFQDLDLLFIAL